VPRRGDPRRTSRRGVGSVRLRLRHAPRALRRVHRGTRRPHPVPLDDASASIALSTQSLQTQALRTALGLHAEPARPWANAHPGLLQSTRSPALPRADAALGETPTHAPSSNPDGPNLRGLSGHPERPILAVSTRSEAANGTERHPTPRTTRAGENADMLIPPRPSRRSRRAPEAIRNRLPRSSPSAPRHIGRASGRGRIAGS
jgi:hypothetical protein